MKTLQSLYIYPIKSCRGISVQNAQLAKRGFPLDRRWMLVDNTGMFLSQRNTKELGKINIHIAGDDLHISAPGQTPLQMPIGLTGAALVQTRIWKDEVQGLHLGGEADIWFSHFLGKEVRLIHMDDSVHRPLKKERLPQDQDFEVSFADGYPYLLCNQSSLDDLNARLEAPIPMDRFRPNLVVSGFPAFEEDNWHRIQIGDAAFLVVKPCARCQVTTIDQHTGIQSKEPLKTLSTYRKLDGKVMFGMNLVAMNDAQVKLGDPVRVIE